MKMQDLKTSREEEIMTSRNVTGCRVLATAVLSMFIFQIAAVAQVEEAERLIYLAKAIKRIVVKQIDNAQPEDGNKAEVQKSFEVKVYDKDGKEVDVSGDQANKLYKWTAKDSSGTSVDQKGVIEQIESAKNKTRKAQNVLKLVMDKGQKASKLEVSLADQFSTYSSAVGESSIAMGKGGAGMFKSIGQWIGKHPYWSTAGAVVAVGGGAAIASGGGGGGSSSGGSGSGATAGDQSATQSGNVDVSGTWRVTDRKGETATMSLSQAGTGVSGTIHDNYPVYEYPTGSISGSVNGNVFSFTATYPNEVSSYTATVNGNTMTAAEFSATR